MKRLFTRHAVLPLAVVLVLAGLYGLAMAVQPVSIAAGNVQAPRRSIPVSAVQRGCPGLGLPGGSSGRVALVAAAPGGAGGQAQVVPLPAAGGRPLLTATHPGALSASEVQPAAGSAPAASSGPAASVNTAKLTGGVVVTATGAMARGLDVEQTGQSGIPSAACGSPGTDFWFVGPGRRSAGRIQLYLMNAGAQPADVTVQIATDAGPLQGSTDTGVAVAPHSMVVQSLAPVVSGSRVVSLHVRTSVGQVVAAVHESTGSSSSGGWLPAAQAPATRLVIPGLPASSGTRRLFITVPGQSDAHVVIKAVTTRGTYEPTGGSGIDVPGSSAVALDLPSMAGIPAALLLKSTQPVTASVMTSGGLAGAPGAFTAAAEPLQEQGVLAVNLAAGGRSSALVLSAPQGAASVRVSELGGAAKAVRIRAGRTTVVQLDSVHGAAHTGFPVVITPQPGSGPVYAGRVILDGGSVAALTPVASALTVVPLPQVRAAVITSRP